MNTKYFALLFFIASAAAAVEIIDPFREARHYCRKQSHLSREQLADAKNNLDIAGDYLTCWVQRVGIPCLPDGQLDPESFVRVTKPVLPYVLSQPLVTFCNEQIVKAHIEDPAAQAVYWTQCLKQLLPDRLLEATGLFKKAIYLRLDQSWF